MGYLHFHCEAVAETELTETLATGRLLTGVMGEKEFWCETRLRMRIIPWWVALWFQTRRYSQLAQQASDRAMAAHHRKVVDLERELAVYRPKAMRLRRIEADLRAEVEFYRGEKRYDVSDRLRKILQHSAG